MIRRQLNGLHGFGLSVLSMLFAFVATSCDRGVGSDGSLVAVFEEEGRQSDTGLYPTFVDDPTAVREVELVGDRRESLTPRFPGTIDLEVRLPAAGFLEFSPALIMMQDVRRARVEFRILVREGGATEQVYNEILRADAANQWHERELDLSRWAGRSVGLTLETVAVPPRGDPLWADRVQTVWGNPVLVSRPGRLAILRGTAVAQNSFDWAADQLEGFGVPPERQLFTWGFAVNLFLGGLLSLSLRELYNRFSGAISDRDSFANTLPLFTVATILVISIVQYSPALALGLVGALSVIRFRTAIASPEELSYLLLCVGLGVAIGANHLALALATIVAVSPFILLRHAMSPGPAASPLILTVAADPPAFFGGSDSGVVDLIRSSTRHMIVERMDRGPERVFLRARIFVESQNQLLDLLTTLRSRVFECQVSSPESEP